MVFRAPRDLPSKNVHQGQRKLIERPKEGIYNNNKLNFTTVLILHYPECYYISFLILCIYYALFIFDERFGLKNK